MAAITSSDEYVVSSMTWHQWHQTADIAKSTGLFSARASWNAASPHSRQRISAARFGRGEKWKSLMAALFYRGRDPDLAKRPGDARRRYPADGPYGCARRSRRPHRPGNRAACVG